MVGYLKFKPKSQYNNILFSMSVINHYELEQF